MRHSILIIDDNPANFEVFKVALGHAWEVFEATSIEEGISILEQEEILLIILDVVINKSSALDFMLKWSANETMHQIPIIFVSSMEERHELHRAMKLGGSGYIFKPLDIQEIQLSVRNQMKMLQIL